MMQQQHLHLLVNEARMASLVDTLDTLHTAASDGRLDEATTLEEHELIGWLYELVYTANETLEEIRGQQDGREAPCLRLLPKSEAS